MIGFTPHARVSCFGPRLVGLLQDAACWSVFAGINVVVCGVEEAAVPVSATARSVATLAVQLMPASYLAEDAEALRVFLARVQPDAAQVRRAASTVTVRWAAPAFGIVGSRPPVDDP